MLLAQDLANLFSLWLEKERIQDALPGYICLGCLAAHSFQEDVEVSLKPFKTRLAQEWQHIADQRQLSVGDLAALDPAQQGCKVGELVSIGDLRTHRLVILPLKLLLDDGRGQVFVILHDEAHGISLFGNGADVRVLGLQVTKEDVLADGLVE